MVVFDMEEGVYRDVFVLMGRIFLLGTPKMTRQE